jgi:hypothetical protein
MVGEAGIPVEEEPENGTSGPRVSWDDKLEGVLDEWHRRVWACQIAHYGRATRLRRGDVILGVPVVILSTVVGTSLFATLNEEQLPLALRIVVGSVSVVAAVLAAIQTFFGFAKQADKHVLAADWYSALRRKVEEVRALPRDFRGDARKVLDDIRREMNHIASQFPQIGEREWARATVDFGIKEPPRRRGRTTEATEAVPSRPS